MLITTSIIVCALLCGTVGIIYLVYWWIPDTAVGFATLQGPSGCLVFYVLLSRLVFTTAYIIGHVCCVFTYDFYVYLIEANSFVLSSMQTLLSVYSIFIFCCCW